MKGNIWNIKEIMQIPSTTKAKSGIGGTTGDYCNMTDSQFQFGSQFWPENSQGFSQEMSGTSRGSQPASQERSELKVSSSYSSKPWLFGDGKAANITGGKTLGVLERFEEDKRKAKESEMLMNRFRQLYESLEDVKRTFVNYADGNCDLIKSAVAEGLDGLRKITQDDLANIKEIIGSQVEMLMSLQNQTNKEMKDSEAKNTLAIKDLSSLIVNLQRDLESFRTEHSNVQSVFGEIQSLLGKIIATHSSGACPRSVKMTDNAAQTSAGLVGKCCVISGENLCCEGVRQCSGAPTHSEEKGQWNLCHTTAKSSEKFNIGASIPGMGSVQQRQLLNCSVAERPCSTQPVVTTAIRNPVVASEVTADLQSNFVARAPVYVEQVKNFGDVEENRFTTWADIPRAKKMSKTGQRSQNYRRKKRALILPQRRSNHRMASFNVPGDTRFDEEKENRVPLLAITPVSKKHKTSTQQQGTAGLENRSECGQHLNSWSWSPSSSSSSEVMVKYKKTEQEIMSEQNTNAIVGQGGIWQLFDFISDSD